MKKRIDFGSVWVMSGAMNVDGSGWWYHVLILPFVIWLRFFATFVSKTVTAHPNPGNMPLEEDGKTPVDFFPACIYLDWKGWWGGYLLNAVGLSNLGIDAYLDPRHRAYAWFDTQTRPIQISFMPVGKTKDDRLAETHAFVESIRRSRLPSSRAVWAIQFNLSCPNVSARAADDVQAESWEHLDILARLGVEIWIKVSVTTDPGDVLRIAEHPACTGICVSNTVAYGKLPELIDWKKLFGSVEHSPLAARLGDEKKKGGLSGAPLFLPVVRWLEEVRRLGATKPINAGGGVLGPRQAWKLLELGAESISLGSIVMLRPWNIPFIMVAVWLYRKMHLR
jgi:dihydroorotate dehydrogenase